MSLPPEGMPTLRDRRFSRSLECGLAILRSFGPTQPMLGIADIADRLGLGRSSTHRYVITLVALGYLEQDASRKYRLAPRSADAGRSFLGSTGLHTKSGPLLEDLRRSTSHAAAIAIFDSRYALCVNRARSYTAGESLLWLRLGMGARLPVDRTAMGRLLLAHLPELRLELTIAALERDPAKAAKAALVQAEPDGFAEMAGFAEAPAARSSKAALLKELRKIRQQGYAVSDEEWLRDIREIAVPVLRPTGQMVAALGILALSATRSIAGLVRDIRPQAEAAAAKLAEQLDDEDHPF